MTDSVTNTATATASLQRAINTDIQNLRNTVDYLVDGSVSLSKYNTVLNEKRDLTLVLNCISHNISTLISSVQLDDSISFTTRNKYKNILHHIKSIINLH
jgi:hypothetical protein